MPLCILCDSEATETAIDADKFVDCPECGQYRHGAGFAAHFAEQSAEFRADLARAVPWKFYSGGGQKPVELGNDTRLAEYHVASVKVFEEDIEEHRRKAVDELTSETFEDDLDESAIAKVSRVLGRSRKKSRSFVEDLIVDGIVEIRIQETQTRPIEGSPSLLRGPLKKYERCKKKGSAESEGSE